jgi:glycosyltransferase involved in cell wall biosynthesis
MAFVVIIHNHPIHYQHLLFRELAKRGMDFEVLFAAASSSSRVEAPLPANHEYPYSIAYAGRYEEAPGIGTSRFVWKALDRIRPKVIIISGYSDAAAWTAWLWAAVHQVDRILWAESNAFDHRRHVWKELPKRIFVKGCALAHVYGTSSLEYLETLGLARDRIRTKRALADTALFLDPCDAGIQKNGAMKLLYCGRLSPEKNLATLIRALAALEQKMDSPRLVLKLVGHGPLEEELHRLVEKLRVTTIVEFAGKAPQSELPRIFRESDVLILPSISEPWGLVVNEAMLSGLPVAVSTQCGCVADLVRPENGWTFSPHSEMGLTKLLVKISDTPREVLEEMGRAGSSVAREYCPENCANAVLEMVSRLLPISAAESL